jgi:hypothetical protein
LVSRTFKTNNMKEDVIITSEIEEKIKLENDLNSEGEKIEYTCCGDEITQQVKETGRCPNCSENI